MKKFVGLFFVIVMSCAPGPNGGSDPNAGEDADGDHITNGEEGSADNLDTDDDGTPDYLDTDADGDGLDDAREAGDDDLATPPVDSDDDGVPDFQDTDSDDNGRDDGTDGFADVDGDGEPDYADADDDGDHIADVDELGDPQTPTDTDGDNIPDFQDTDADNDTILDRYEGVDDFDHDNLPNFQDPDSDGDCVPDYFEAGGNPPIDSDADGRLDFLDLDSDGDGLGDGTEDGNCNGIQDAGETNPNDQDSDGDGVSDLVEETAGTDPNNGNDNPQAHGNFFFLIPYHDPTTPSEDTLKFRTSVQFADVYFNFDISGSMTQEISAMANTSTGVPAIISQLKCQPVGGTCNIDSDCTSNAICFDGQCVQDPTLGDGCIPDLWTGVGQWNDVNTYHNVLSLQPDPAVTAANITPPSFPGGAEAIFQPEQCVADGIGCTSPAKNCATSGLGCPGFRHETTRIVIHISDADNQCSSCSQYTATSAGNALQARGIKYIGLYGTDDDSSGNPGSPQSDMAAVGLASGTVDSSGNPFVYPAIDSAVVTQTKNAVLDIVKGLPLDVTIAANEVNGDDGDALRFIDYLQVNTSGVGQCTAIASTADGNGDGHDDMFPDLLPGARVCWDIVPVAENTIVPATDVPQLFIAHLRVLGDGSLLDGRDVYFLVPPAIDVPR